LGREEYQAAMPKTIPMIGLSPEELPWMRLLAHLLRHPDPGVPELARQALLYLDEAANKCETQQSLDISTAK
jgi:hypothetical protein